MGTANRASFPTEKQLKGEAKARKMFASKTRGSKKAQKKEIVVVEEEEPQ
jgi:hypothetical protein